LKDPKSNDYEHKGKPGIKLRSIKYINDQRLTSILRSHIFIKFTIYNDGAP